MLFERFDIVGFINFVGLGDVSQGLHYITNW